MQKVLTNTGSPFSVTRGCLWVAQEELAKISVRGRLWEYHRVSTSLLKLSPLPRDPICDPFGSLHAAHCLSEVKASRRELYMAKAGYEARIDLTHLLISDIQIQWVILSHSRWWYGCRRDRGICPQPNHFHRQACPPIPGRCVQSGGECLASSCINDTSLCRKHSNALHMRFI